ncbi:hypothetical protein ACGF0J_22045 [Nonomuraea sp. NPDC047897]|uniref:hypothetical protein n=1 Tax=Nonomuraea sp. NPDC047897 TaxID=3364346 RepID=UPI003717F1C8
MSLRERLLNRPRPSDTYPLRIEDDTEPRREVEQAQTLLRILGIPGDAADQAAVRKAQAALKKAEAKLKACYEFVTLRALPADDFEALVGAHKPRPETDDRLWNNETFPKACLLACVESDLSEEDWELIWTTVLSNAERIELSNAAIRVNVRVPDSSLPKGWAQIEG